MRRTTTIVTALLSCVAGLQIARGQSSDTGPTPGTAQPAGSAQPAGAGAPAPVVKLPEVDVIGATPLLGTGVALLLAPILFNKNLMRTLLQEKIALPDPAWSRLNLAWSAFFAVLGVVNLYVAFNYTTDAWVNFKLFGATGMMLAFVLLQSLWLSKYVDEDKKDNQ